MPAETAPAIKQQGAAFWDANPCGGAWTSYAEYLRWLQATEPYMFAIFDEYDWRNKRVIEVGCGQGAMSSYVRGRGARTTCGLDMSRHSLDRARAGARELGARMPLVHGDAERLPFRDGAFDAAICVGVLHHTSDTEAGVRELYRVLRPGGAAFVMLYRTGNPKWWATRLVRAAVRRQLARGRARGAAAGASVNHPAGTAWLELFGVPVMKAFSNRRALGMFSAFSSATVANHQPGFARLADVAPLPRAVRPLLGWCDRRTRRVWGFYQVIVAVKQPAASAARAALSE